MFRPDALFSAPRNRLLAGLPMECVAKLWPHLRPVQLRLDQGLIYAGQPITGVYFPETSCAVVRAQLARGDVEVGVVGPEGMVGVPLLLGQASGTLDATVQQPGIALRLEADLFGRALDHVPGLKECLLRYALAFERHVAQALAGDGARRE